MKRIEREPVKYSGNMMSSLLGLVEKAITTTRKQERPVHPEEQKFYNVKMREWMTLNELAYLRMRGQQ
jgi:hypothetical protein